MATMQLEFSQAMNDFKTMFPEMEPDVIEAVLRANSGAVDATIDQLLAMSIDNQNEKLRNELETDSPRKGSAIATFNPNATITVGISPRRPAIGTPAKDQVKVVSPVKSRWNPPMLGPLPPTFLRLGPSAAEFNLDDEQFAMMLQNEEFMNELRWNQEFLSALEKDKVQADVPFKERLRHMGKVSRKKFTQMARVFTWKNKKPSTVRHPDSLLLEEEHSDEDEPKRSALKK